MFRFHSIPVDTPCFRFNFTKSTKRGRAWTQRFLPLYMNLRQAAEHYCDKERGLTFDIEAYETNIPMNLVVVPYGDDENEKFFALVDEVSEKLQVRNVAAVVEHLTGKSVQGTIRQINDEGVFVMNLPSEELRVLDRIPNMTCEALASMERARQDTSSLNDLPW